MNAFYRALGSVGGEMFEASGPYPPRASLKYPDLAAPNPAVRAARTEVLGGSAAAPDAHGQGDHELEERPGRLAEPGASRGKIIVGAVVAVALVIAVAVAAVVSSRSSRPTVAAPEPATNAEPAANPAPGAGAAAAPAASAGAVAPSSGSTSAQGSGSGAPGTADNGAAATPGAAAAAAATGTKPAAAGGHTRKRSSADAVRALGGVIDEAKGADGKPARARSSTPPELKDPFQNP